MDVDKQETNMFVITTSYLNHVIVSSLSMFLFISNITVPLLCVSIYTLNMNMYGYSINNVNFDLKKYIDKLSE